MKRTELRRKSPLLPSGWGVGRKSEGKPARPTPRTKRRARDTGPSLKVRVLVRERDGDRCVRCGVYCGPGGAAGQLHHRAPRRMGGSRSPYINSPANLVLLDAACHAAIESHRTIATAQGFLLRKPSHAAEVPVMAHDGWHLYLPDGTRQRVFRDDGSPLSLPTNGADDE